MEWRRACPGSASATVCRAVWAACSKLFQASRLQVSDPLESESHKAFLSAVPNI